MVCGGVVCVEWFVVELCVVEWFVWSGLCGGVVSSGVIV